ncbi:hypothetical protein HD806DRAFT_528441 [Xylariaceae sp. AK1471]|nr:hypothetical protein HD806DRAFT_528441 [Xylariaceae sp. AK1471]
MAAGCLSAWSSILEQNLEGIRASYHVQALLNKQMDYPQAESRPGDPTSPPFHLPNQRVVDATHGDIKEQQAREQQQTNREKAQEQERVIQETLNTKKAEDYRKDESAAKGFDDDTTYIPNIKK